MPHSLYGARIDTYNISIGTLHQINNPRIDSLNPHVKIWCLGSFEDKRLDYTIYFVRNFEPGVEVIGFGESNLAIKTTVIYDFSYYEACVDILRNECPINVEVATDGTFGLLCTSSLEPIGENE